MANRQEQPIRCRGRVVRGLLLVCLVCFPAVVRAQSPPPRVTLSFSETVPPPDAGPLPAPQPAEIAQASCIGCNAGGTLGLSFASDGPGCGCGGGNCVPGRKPCYPCEADSAFGRFLCGLYQCLCCPDPCYEPRWTPLADSAFFVDSARPQTQTRLRWDAGLHVPFPDRAEFFWARADGKGKGPAPPSPFLGEKRVSYNDLSLYTEGATGLLGVFVEMPYRSTNPDLTPHHAGFADMNLGTKSLIFDCELLQVAFQFRTYLPVGNPIKGLGTGHVSLEPSLIVGLRLAQDTYLQSQFAEWIPLGGDPNYAGAVFHYHLSLNQVLCRILPDVPLIGTAEMNGWTFQDGAYTDPTLGAFQRASNDTYVSAGLGLRLFVCDRIDVGVSASCSLTDPGWASPLFRSEFRWRF